MYYSLSTIKKLITDHQSLEFDYAYQDIYLARLLQTSTTEVVNYLQNKFDQYQLNDIRLLLLLAIRSKDQDGITPSALGDMFNISRVQITRQLDFLEKNIWIERKTHPADRRSQHIYLTQEGKAFLLQVLPPLQQNLVDLLSVISKDEKILLINLLTKLLTYVTESQ